VPSEVVDRGVDHIAADVSVGVDDPLRLGAASPVREPVGKRHRPEEESRHAQAARLGPLTRNYRSSPAG
jgi:hypothetical protein